LKEQLQKYMTENEKIGIIKLRYIDDIHVIDVSFSSQQCSSRVFDTGSVGMSVIQSNTIGELLCSKRLSKGCGVDAHREQNKVLSCSPLASYLTFKIYHKDIIIVTMFRLYEKNCCSTNSYTP
jgi:hypothetical protein